MISFSTESCYFPQHPTTVVAPAGQRTRRKAPTRTTPSKTARPKDFSRLAQRLQAGEPFVSPQGNVSSAYLAGKRLFDIVCTLALLALVGPVMAVVLLVLLVTTRGKPFYCQRRVGYCGRPFRMFKFRTMVDGAAQQQHNVANEQDGPIFKNRRDPRITWLGRMLRKTSLDETPQLINVLAGQMSLVGPRPLPVGEVARFDVWQRPRLAVMPGLTCLWQVSGRSEIGFEDWMRLDLRYVRNQSFWTDFKLLLRTPVCVLTGRGAY